jgi:hypothetical protein
MKKVVLVSAGVSRGEYPQFTRFMPLTPPGLHYIVAALKSANFEVELVNQTNDGLADIDVVAAVRNLKPDILLFNQFYSTRERVRRIVSSIPDKPIIGVGGHDATFHCVDSPTEYSVFDFVWKGEADEGLAEFLQSFKGNGQTIIVNNIESRVQDLDSLPILLHDDYLGDVGFLVTSRGCYPRGCEFCTTPKFYPDGRKTRSVEHVTPELENLVSAGKKYIFITDDNFLGFSSEDLERSEAIIARCKNLDLKIMFFSIKEQIITASQQGLLEKWRGTVYRVHTGIENADACAARDLGKVGVDKSYISKGATAIAALYRHGIAVFLGYVNFNPNSTLEQLSNSATFLHTHHNEAADFTHLRQGLRFYPGALQPSHFGLDGIYVCNGEFFYEFNDPRVKQLYESLWEIQDKSLSNLINLLYGTTDLIYINQLQDKDVGVRYWQIKAEISTLNYEFFMYCLNQCQENKTIDKHKVDLFLGETRGLARKLASLNNEIKGISEYN